MRAEVLLSMSVLCCCIAVYQNTVLLRFGYSSHSIRCIALKYLTQTVPPPQHM